LLSDRVDRSSACNSLELLIIRVQRIELTNVYVADNCRSWALKIRPDLLPGRRSYEATKPGFSFFGVHSVCCLHCFDTVGWASSDL